MFDAELIKKRQFWGLEFGACFKIGGDSFSSLVSSDNGEHFFLPALGEGTDCGPDEIGDGLWLRDHDHM
jgi:hypothetical protein